MNIVITTALLFTNVLLVRENAELKAGGPRESAAPGGAGIAEGQRLEPLDVVGPGGVERSLFAFHDSTPHLLFFFDTSCPHCRNAVPDWNRLFVLAREGGPEVIGVSLDDTASTGRYADEFGILFPVVSASDPGYAEGQGIQGVPATVLVDGDAVVVGAWAGEPGPEGFAEIADLVFGRGPR